MTSVRPYYRLADMTPPLRIQVYVLVEGREFLASIERHPETKAERWVEWACGKPRVLAWAVEVHMVGDARRGVAITALWRPQHAAAWRMPLPEPVTGAEVGIMWSSRSRFQAVEDAESAELAREMESDRETARAQGEAPSYTRGARRRMWWLNPAEVSYAQPGLITVRDAEGRLMRAVASDSFSGNSAPSIAKCFTWNGNAALDEAALRRLAEAEAKRPEEEVPRFQALQADHQDYTVAMGWFSALSGPHQTVIRLASRMQGYSFGEIAWIIGGKLKPTACAERYKAAVASAHVIANGGVSGRVAEKRAALADLRSRNMAARRAG
jgi:hypothetical protein